MQHLCAILWLTPGKQLSKRAQTFTRAMYARIEFGNTVKTDQGIHQRKSSKCPLKRRKKISAPQKTRILKAGTIKSVADNW